MTCTNYKKEKKKFLPASSLNSCFLDINCVIMLQIPMGVIIPAFDKAANPVSVCLLSAMFIGLTHLFGFCILTSVDKMFIRFIFAKDMQLHYIWYYKNINKYPVLVISFSFLVSDFCKCLRFSSADHYSFMFDQCCRLL